MVLSDPCLMAFGAFPNLSHLNKGYLSWFASNVRLCQSGGMLFPSYITKALWLSSCMFSSSLFYPLLRRSQLPCHKAMLWRDACVRNCGLPIKWHVTKQLSRSTTMREPSDETTATVNSLVAIQPLPNRFLWFSRKHITDSFLLIYLFMSGCCLGCNLSPLPHQKTHYIVCLVQ